jgi:hypothetical protein
VSLLESNRPFLTVTDISDICSLSITIVELNRWLAAIYPTPHMT